MPIYGGRFMKTANPWGEGQAEDDSLLDAPSVGSGSPLRVIRRHGDRHHVVVIGSGFGGLFAVKGLRKSEVDVTVISRTSYHLFQPLLYQVATGVLSQGEIAPPTR